MMFLEMAVGLIGVVGSLLWFTGWAEERVVSAEAKPVKAKPT